MSLTDSLFGKKERTDFKTLIQNGAIVIDVRSPMEYNSGHVPGSVNIPLEQIGSSVSQLKQKNKPVILVCRSGARSGMATGILKNAGLEAWNGGPWDALAAKMA